MPELPEVETMRRGILGAEGSRIVAARRSGCRKRPLTMRPAWPAIARRLKGAMICQIGRHGKRLQIGLDNGWTIVIEPRMSGLVLVERPPTEEHLRFAIELAGGDCRQIRYWDRRGLGQVHLLNPKQLVEFFHPSRIGPDALSIGCQQLCENLGNRSIPVKVGLLDQKAVAGVGNIYASEILHLAGVHPQIACAQVTRRQWQHIHQHLREVMRRAIQLEGSTLADGTYRNALNDPGSYQNHHTVYNRAGELCGRCRRGKIKRIVQSQRSTYFCPRCQSRRR